MNPGRLVLVAMVGAVALVGAGCGGQEKPPAPDPGASSTPQLVTNLKSLSDDSVRVDPFKGAVPDRGDAILRSEKGKTVAPRTFQEQPGAARAVGTDDSPGQQRLTNDKAARFGSFSQSLLDHLFTQVRVAERTEEIARLKLPRDLKLVVVTAIMNKDGKLTELILEQHSGKTIIDKMLLDSCKKGLWYKNPPPDALSGDGNYKLTIEMRIENYASSDETHWNFKTYLGLALA
jgi:hypothetical protein